METKHIPGPWEVGSKTKTYGKPIIEIKSHYQDGGINYSILGAVASVGGHHDEAEATARLIAAAPELLEALYEVLAYEERGSKKGEPRIGNGILNIIHKAIDKATNGK